MHAVLTLRVLLFLILLTLFPALQGCERITGAKEYDDGIPPAIPTGLSLRFARDGEIYFSWKRNTEPDFEKYYIYRSTDSIQFQLTGETSNPYFYDDSLEYATVYHYRVFAEDVSNLRSLASATLSARPENQQRPSKPLGIEVNGRNLEGIKFFHIQWQPVKESDVSHYEVFRGTSADFPADSNHRVGSTLLPFYSDSTPPAELTEFFYKVLSVDKGGLRSDASGSSGDIILPLPKIISPQPDESFNGVPVFRFSAVPFRADYEIILSDNELYGQVWTETLSPSQTSGIIEFTPKSFYIGYNRAYFLRVAAYSKQGYPNAITKAIRIWFR